MVPVSDMVLTSSVLSTSSSLYLSLRSLPGSTMPTVWSQVITVSIPLTIPVLNMRLPLVFTLDMTVSITGLMIPVPS